MKRRTLRAHILPVGHRSPRRSPAPMRRRTLAAALPLVLGAAVAACGPTPADIAVSSPDDALRTGSRLVFSTVDEEARPARTVTVRNPGGADLQVTGLVVTDAFALASGQPTSFTVAP